MGMFKQKNKNIPYQFIFLSPIIQLFTVPKVYAPPSKNFI